MKSSHPIRVIFFVSFIILFQGYRFPAKSAPLDLSDLPLFLSSSKVPANILFVLDDSGSMDWEVMTKDVNHDGIFASDQPDGSQLSNPDDVRHRDNNDDGIADCTFGENQTFGGYIYTTRFDTNTYNSGGKQNCNIADDRAWRFRNSDFNPLYFNPNRTYKPWIGYDESNVPFQDMPITAAKENPFKSNSRTIDLTRQNSNLSTSDHDKDLKPDGFRYYTWNDLDGDGNFDNGEETEHLIKNADAKTQQNFANWFSYHRKREYVAKAAFGELFATLPSDFRAGLITLNNNGKSNLEIKQINEDIKAGHQRDLLNSLYQIQSNNGTPLRVALNRAGSYMECNNGTDLDFPCPVLGADQGGSCQQNFIAVMTDGFYRDDYSGTGNTDGDSSSAWDGGAYADQWSDTLADIAMKYYERDLDGDKDNNKVPVIPGIDEATHQHVVTYAIAFGVDGTLNANPLNNADSFDWPNPQPNIATAKAEKIDDLRHAAYNGRGEFLSVQKPEQLVRSLHTLLDSIQNRESSAASVALNSGSFNKDSQLYQAKFVSGAWSGHLEAHSIGEDGVVKEEVAWDAGKKLDERNWDTERQILTYNNETKHGVAFRWSAFSPTMQELLHHNIDGVKDNQGEARTEFLRGKRDSEGKGFRRRRQVLGDLINSDPIFVGAPSFPNEISTDGSYAQFRKDHIKRKHMIYVGGNDGMLHGFRVVDKKDESVVDEDGGVELLAYVPRAIFDGLGQLTDPKYRHRYYVDGSPSVADVYGNFNSCVSEQCWRSVLVSGLRKGGQAVFSLDVTEPNKFLESQAKDIVVWEFTDSNDTDLGYTYSAPSLVKMTNERWAVIFGNGYNNTEADGHASTTGQAALFILFFDKKPGDDWLSKRPNDNNYNYVKIPVGTSNLITPNGLSSPAAIDIDGDFDTEYIYAGDLQGNLWKFDVQDKDPDNWTAVTLFSATSGDGTPQPITSQPEVGKHPEGGVMVYFGTGKYLENGDHSTAGAQVQTFYGIRDKLEVSTSLVSRKTLFPHTIKDYGETRITTTSIADDDCVSQYNGWYMNLPTNGERQVTDPLLRNGRIIFTTMIPSTVPCSFGGDSWIMEVDAICGNRLEKSPFDLNDDHEFTDADKVDYPPITVSGIKSTEGLAPSPSVLFAKTKEYKYVSGSTGGIFRTVENPGDNARGRIAWQQFK